MLYWIFRFFSFLILKIVFGLRVFGREHIPKSGGFILAGNHVSYLDPPAVGVACPRKLNFMAKEELFRNPLSACFFYAIEVFPVKRSSADLSALKEAMRRVRQGYGLALFPEGSRRFDGANTQPHAGIGFLTAKLNVPVIPAFIRGTDSALPKGAKFIRPRQISVYFGEKISIEKNLSYQDIAQTIMASIRQLEKNS